MSVLYLAGTLSKSGECDAQRIAVVVNSARWMDVFGSASLPLRARMISVSTRGAMSALTAVPSTHRGQLLPLSFITAVHLAGPFA